MKFSKCNILGNQISVISMSAIIEELRQHITVFGGQYICVCNVHTTVMAYESKEYQKIQNSAVLNLPDGKPLSIVAHMHGYKSMGRVAGPDLMHEVFSISGEQGWKHYFYGSTVETLSLLSNKLKQTYPGIQIVGTDAPPFRPLTIEEDKDVIQAIDHSEADFIWIGLGAPKQEQFMYEHQGKFQGVMIGVGAGFNFHAGTVKRAPLWMQRVGMEWFYRMLQEPRKLWKRYLRTNLKFIRLIGKKGMVQ